MIFRISNSVVSIKVVSAVPEKKFLIPMFFSVCTGQVVR